MNAFEMLSVYENFLADIGAIDRAAVLQAERDRSKVNETAFTEAYRAARQKEKATPPRIRLALALAWG